MISLLAPFFLFIASIIGFLTIIQPTYNDTKAIRAQVETHDAALNSARRIEDKKTELTTIRGNFDPNDVDNLEKLLPDNVDNVRLILDIDGIAARYNMRVSNVQLETIATVPGGAPEVVVQNEATHQSLSLGFSVKGTYDEFRDFLHSLERSLRLVEISNMDFGAQDAQGKHSFNIKINTFWLK